MLLTRLFKSRIQWETTSALRTRRHWTNIAVRFKVCTHLLLLASPTKGSGLLKPKPTSQLPVASEDENDVAFRCLAALALTNMLPAAVPVSTSSGLHHRLPAQLSRSSAAFRHISRVTPVVIVAVARESPGAATCSCRLQRVFSRLLRRRRVRGRR